MAALALLQIMFRRKKRTQKSFEQLESNLAQDTGSMGNLMRCRICLKDGDIPIFKERRIADDIRQFAEIELREEDELPKRLCRECYGLLQSAVHFRNLAQDSDRKLRRPEVQGLVSFSDDNDDGVNNDTEINDGKRNDEDIYELKNSYRCKICGINFKNVDELLEHRKSLTHREAKAHRKQLVRCPHCHVMVNKGDFRAHLTQLHAALDLKKFSELKELVNLSDAGGIDKETEINFNEDIKDDSNLYRCKRCQIEFRNAEELLEHRKSESHRKPRVQCPQCHVTVGKGSLRAHVTRLHTALQAYMCDVCGKSFGMKGSFKRHLMIHTDELPFRCERCPYRCRYRASLTEHTRVHTGEKPYACAHCPATFPNASNFRKHSRTHQAHTQYKCEHCQKGFHTMHKMKAHIKVEHMGLKEHVCHLCGKEFGYKEKLGQHLKNVHKRPKKRSGRLPLYLEIDEKLNRQRKSEQAEEHPP